MINGTAVEECAKSSETAYFWYRTTLDAAPSMDDNGGFKWWIVLCLMLSWTIVFFIVMKGIQSSGKVRKIEMKLHGVHVFNVCHFRSFISHPFFLILC